MLKEKPWQLHLVLRLVAGLCACVALSFLIVNGYTSSRGGNVSDDISVLVALTGTMTAHGVGLLLINVFLKQHQMTWGEAFGVQKSGSLRALLLGWFMAVLMLPVSWSLNLLSGRILEWFDRPAKVQSSIELLQTTQSFWQIAYFGLVALLFAPVFEELVFRGILYPSLKRFYSRKVAIWVSSILFAVIHWNNMTFVPLTVFAVVLCLLYETTGTILAPMFAHACFNAANFFYVVVFKS